MLISKVVQPEKFNSARITELVAHNLQIGPESPLRGVLLTAVQLALDALVAEGTLETKR